MNWEKDKEKIASIYFECINLNNKELFTRLSNNTKKSGDIYQIVNFITDRLAAVWFLTRNDMLWDADIIDRSALETLIKLVFIVQSPDENEQKQRLTEFWSDLSEIHSLAQSEQSKKQVKYFKDKASQLAHLPMILTEEQELVLRNKWNKRDRNKLSQKWSFTPMLYSIAESYNGKPLDMIVGLAHEYRMCSHLSHGDETGIGIIEERRSRPERDRELVHRAHLIKLLSNCLAYASWTAVTVMEYLGEDKKFFFDIYQKLDQIKKLEQPYHEAVFDDPDYDKYKEEVDGQMKMIVLITCVKKKQNRRCKAEDLYISPFFKKSLAYARSLNPDKIFILSAKYGLLELKKKVESYEMTLNTFKAKELKEWAEGVLEQLRQEADIEQDKFVFLAGDKYRKYLLPKIRDCEIPLKGLGIGKQLQFLTNKLR